VTTDYCDLSDACALLPGGPTLRNADAGPPVVTATVPSMTQGEAILASVAAEIDMHLRGRGYSVPITDDDAFASLKTVCMNGAAARIGKAMPSKDDKLLDNLREDYKAGLDFIDKGGIGDDAAVEDTNGFAHGFPSRCHHRRWVAPF
jgi:hypothetical protein